MTTGVSGLRRGTAVLAARQRRLMRMGNLPEEDVYDGRIQNHGLELTFLGTSSQVCARRHPSSLAMRLRGHNGTHTWLFDAGEGALSQMQRSHLRVTQLSKIFITHMHPDHVYGLPGIVMAALSLRDAREASNADSCENPSPLTVYGPPGIGLFLRASLGATLPSFRKSSLLQIVELPIPKDVLLPKRYSGVKPFWNSNMRRLPFEIAAPPVTFRRDNPSGNPTYDLLTCSRSPVDRAFSEPQEVEHRNAEYPATVRAGIISHSVPSIAYVVDENVAGFRFDKSKLASVGLPVNGKCTETGRDMFRLLMTGAPVEHEGRIIRPSDVKRAAPRARRVCICGDTNDASGIAHLAKDVDVLVHEATVRAADTHIARKRGHSSSTSAASFAKRIGAKRLILNHTSVGYDAFQVRSLEDEARAVLGSNRAYVAHELSVFNIPSENQDSEEWSFRAFLGHPRFGNSTLLRNAAAMYNKSTEISDMAGYLPGLVLRDSQDSLALGEDKGEDDCPANLGGATDEEADPVSPSTAGAKRRKAATTNAAASSFPSFVRADRPGSAMSKRPTFDEKDLAAPIRGYEDQISGSASV